MNEIIKEAIAKIVGQFDYCDPCTGEPTDYTKGGMKILTKILTELVEEIKNEKRPSAEWHELYKQKYGMKIIDPDGWNRTRFDASWAEKITWQEFENKALMSTQIPLHKSYYTRIEKELEEKLNGTSKTITH